MIEQVQSQILDGIEKLATALNEHRNAALEHGEAEHSYRQLRAREFVRVSLGKDDNGKKLTDPHKNALVDLATDKAMLRIRMAEAEHEASWELVKSLKAQISALQSVLNANRVEAETVMHRQTAGA